MHDNEFAMVGALVLGYDDEIDQPLMNAYSHTGTLHVLSVSGLHVGVIYLMLGFLLGFMDRHKKLKWLKVVFILLSLWFFVLLSGFSAPAVRAALMFSLILFGKTLFENVEVSNIVFVSAFLSLCYNPYWLADAGFQLSYTAVLGIVFLYPYFYNMFYFSSGFLEKIWALCSVSLAAQVATLPITLYYFHQFPTLFLITNIILIPISTIIMYGGMLILVFSKIAGITKLLVWLTGACIKLMNGAALFFDQLPFCVIDSIHLSLLNMALMYLLIIIVFVAIEKRSYRLLLGSLVLCAGMLSISILFSFEAKKNNEIVIYHDQGGAMSVFDGSVHTVLSDSASARLQATIRENHVMRDMIYQNSLQLDGTSLIVIGDKKILYLPEASKYSKKLLALFEPQQIWSPARSLKKRKQQKNIRDNENLIVSGRLYRHDLHPATYFTEKKGAFIVSLRDEYPHRK
jgi:competence protein ComEC